MERIYQLPKNVAQFPDMSFAVMDNPVAAKFIIKNDHQTLDRVLFPEAHGSLDAAIELKEQLRYMQEASVDVHYTAEVGKFERFGIPSGAEEVVEHILESYLEVCRDKRLEGQGFGPGVQFNYVGFNDFGVDVTYGNYGLYFATLVESTKIPEYRDMLIKAGEEFLDNRAGFFTNLPATSTVIESNDGILYVQRGATAEYPHMLHQLLSGHHSPEKAHVKPNSNGMIPLQGLVREQLIAEVGQASADKLSNVLPRGLAFSTGYEIHGTEKVEILTYARLDMSVEEVAESIRASSSKKWSSKRLFVADPSTPLVYFTTQKKLPDMNIFEGIDVTDNVEDIPIKADKLSKTAWVPSGLAALIAHQMRDEMELHVDYQPR